MTFKENKKPKGKAGEKQTQIWWWVFCVWEKL
jgi:hypothetical protein